MPKTRFTSPGSIPNHRLLKNLQLDDNYLSNDGGDEGITVDNSGVVTMSSQLDIGNMSLTTSELDISSGAFTLDVAGDIKLEAGGNDISFGSATLDIFSIMQCSDKEQHWYYDGTNYFFLAVAADGATTLSTVDASTGTSGNLTLDSAPDSASEIETRTHLLQSTNLK